MIKITKTFEGYPDFAVVEGKRKSGRKRVFLSGETVTNVSPEYEALVVGKGLAELPPPKPAPPMPPAPLPDPT